MRIDKLTKSIRATIAVGLWVIATNPWLHPTSVAAQEKTDLTQVESYLSSIEMDIAHIARGTCTNPKLLLIARPLTLSAKSNTYPATETQVCRAGTGNLFNSTCSKLTRFLPTRNRIMRK